MKVRVDHEKCLIIKKCTSLAEAVFAFNDEGKVSAGEVTADDEEAVESAVSSCPVEAIVKE